MRTLQTIYNNLLSAIHLQDIHEKKAISSLLLAHFFDASRLDIMNNKPVDDTHIDWESIVARINQHEPIQYILGETDFYGLSFLTAPGVLIPRPETEELVDILYQKYKNTTSNILDIGTGSGCIAVTLAKKIPTSTVTAWDISEKALSIARQNGIKHGVHVQFEQIDILDYQPTTQPTYDLLVSNPPYICQSERTEMHENVLQYEPSLALFVPDETPLLFYEQIARIGQKLLKPSGLLAFEINRAYGYEMKEMLIKMGYESCTIQKDISQNDRFVFGYRPK